MTLADLIVPVSVKSGSVLFCFVLHLKISAGPYNCWATVLNPIQSVLSSKLLVSSYDSLPVTEIIDQKKQNTKRNYIYNCQPIVTKLKFNLNL